MTKNDFLNYINCIINNFDKFKSCIENHQYKEAEKFFNDNLDIKTFYSNPLLSNIICLEANFLKNNNAIELYEIYIELITYLTFFKDNINDRSLIYKIKLTISTIQDDFMPITEKLVRIELLKLLNILFSYEDLLNIDSIQKVCRNFQLEFHSYIYLLGYDTSKTEYQQISFIKNNKIDDIDSVAGHRRINYRKKLTNDITIDFLNNPSFLELLPLIKKYIGDNSYFILEEEIKSLIIKKHKYKEVEKEEFQYFFTIK